MEAPSGVLVRLATPAEASTRPQAPGPTPEMRLAPRPSPVLFQWVTTTRAAPACWHTPWMPDSTAPMAYRSAPLAAPATARYSGSSTTRAAGCSASSAATAWSSSPRGQLGHPEAQPQPPPRGQLAEVEVLVGADGLQPAHHGPLPTLAQEDQHRPGGWAGEVAEPGHPGGDRAGQVQHGPGLAGLVLGREHPVGVPGPHALDQPGRRAGGRDAGQHRGQVLDHQPPPRRAGQPARAGGWVQGEHLGQLAGRLGGQRHPVAVQLGPAAVVGAVAGHAAPSRRRRGLAAPPASPEVIVARALASGLPASRAAANSTARTSSASSSRAATSWPRLNAARFKVALRRPGGAAATAVRSRARAARP